jgi:hypothetical protein
MNVAPPWKEKRADRMMVRSWTLRNPIWDPLGTSCLKEEAVVAVGECTARGIKTSNGKEGETLQAETLERKER